MICAYAPYVVLFFFYVYYLNSSHCMAARENNVTISIHILDLLDDGERLELNKGWEMILPTYCPI